MDSQNKNKLKALHSLLDKELEILQQQLSTETDQGYLFKNSYLQRIKQAEQISNLNKNDNYSTTNEMNKNEERNFKQMKNMQHYQQQEQQQNLVDDDRSKGLKKGNDTYLNTYQYNNNLEFNDNTNFTKLKDASNYPYNLNPNDHQDFNYQKQKQTFITDYGSQISFQQRTSQYNSQAQTEGVDTEGQYINFLKQEEENNDPFANVNLQKEINGLQQKIQFLEQKFNQSTNENSLSNKNDQKPNLKRSLENEQNKINNKYNELKNEQNYTHKNLQTSNNSNNSSFTQTVKIPSDSNHLRVDEYLNTQETFKRLNKHQPATLQTNLESTQNSKDKRDKQKLNQNNSFRNDISAYSSSKSPQNVGKTRPISSKSSRIIYQTQDNNSFGGLEREIEGAEQSLDVSKRSLKQTLNKSSSRSNLKTDTTVNRSNYSYRQLYQQNGISKRSTSQKSQRDRSLSQGHSPNIFFPIDNFAQQYHESVELKQKIAQTRKQYEMEKEILNEEREKNKIINEEMERLQNKIKKVQMLVEKNQQNEKDYYKLQESYNKSESIRKQQKQLILQLKEEIEMQKNNQNKPPILVYDNGNSSKRRNSKRLSTSSSQKHPKKQ